MIPNHIKGVIDRYVQHGYDGGSFVEALMTNDLVGVFSRGDDENIRYLKDIVQYCYMKIPASCWGSEEKYNKWLSHNGFDGEENDFDEEDDIRDSFDYDEDN